MGIKPLQKVNETQNLQEQCDVDSTMRSRMLEGKPIVVHQAQYSNGEREITLFLFEDIFLNQDIRRHPTKQ